MHPLIFAALIAAAPAPSSPSQGGSALDQKRIHREYNDGNFESVLAEIEGFQKTHATYSASDSVFIAKHLAVVYSANPNTREKGKYYMFRLLEMLPSAKLVDMYVSDEIDRIFEKVREEFVTRQKGFGVDSTDQVLPQRAPVNEKKAEAAPPPAAEKTAAQARRPEAGRSNHKAAWIAGGVVAATVGLAAVYFLASSEPSKEDKVYDVP